ncbi:hypothetical protein [Amycolatopsis sp. GM8]|uniref:hypothetical protein n=1 Tax=Amycolatopsis sp. GM8 TaxID=2896530 RepID=UPI001F208126|nr:hypothetical protein [Amycolatopsis sp. GM8]
MRPGDVQYPLDPTDPAEDARFTFGLIHDVADLLAVKGYPKIKSDPDLVRLRQALYEFFYSSEFWHYF